MNYKSWECIARQLKFKSFPIILKEERQASCCNWKTNTHNQFQTLMNKWKKITTLVMKISNELTCKDTCGEL
jgi:hypothetical protein